MNIVVMTFGSRGDVQPFLALAVALRDRGHTVTLAAPGDFEALIGSYDLPYIRIPLNNLDFLQNDKSKQVSRGLTPKTIIMLLREVLPELKRGLLAATYEVSDTARNSDLLIAHGFLTPAAYSIHQHLQIPLMLGIAAPIVPTKAFPIFSPVPIAKNFYNPLTFQILVRSVLSPMIGPMNAYRKNVGLPKLSSGKIIHELFYGETPLIMHYSPHLVPPPPDWPAKVHVTGAWPLKAPSDWTPQEDLTTFLAQGEPPVFFGFGSMPFYDSAKMGQMISDALRANNLRGVLQAGWGGLAHEDEHLITIGDVPHSWLFPQMTAAVHHGGAGTTHSVLSAGLPSLIVPFSGDQPLWGRWLAELGVNVPPIKPKKLTVESLSTALHTLTQDEKMRQRAAEVGALLRADDGLTKACVLVEQYVN